MKNDNKKLGWIFINSQSNEYKVERFKQTALLSEHKIVLVNSEDLYLKNTPDGVVELIDTRLTSVIEIPDFVISLIPDEKYDSMAYRILEYLESKSVMFLNSIKSVRLATDKFKANILLSNNGFKVPSTLLISKFSKPELDNFPLIIKPLDGRKSRGVKVINSNEDLSNYFKNTDELLLVIQEFMSDSFGKDIRTYVLDGKLIGAVKREKRKDKKNLLPIYNSSKIDLNEEFSQKAVSIASLFGLTFCSVDFFIDDQNTVCEVNANPGYKNLEKNLSIILPELLYNYFK